MGPVTTRPGHVPVHHPHGWKAEPMEPKDQEEREGMLREFNSNIKAAPQIIKRLKNKEFKTRAEVLSALTALSSTAKEDVQIGK